MLICPAGVQISHNYSSRLSRRRDAGMIFNRVTDGPAPRVLWPSSVYPDQLLQGRHYDYRPHAESSASPTLSLDLYAAAVRDRDLYARPSPIGRAASAGELDRHRGDER